jgi:ubiquinone/menaquinone biosynthesis C-methylase UbiE
VRQHPEAWSTVHERFEAYSSETARLARGLPPCSRVLDVACGTGEHLIELSKLGYRGVGVDRSFAKLLRARETAAIQRVSLSLVCGDLRQLPIRSEFDLVVYLYAPSMLKTAEELRVALQRLRRVLTKSGRLVFNVINADANSNPRSPTHAAVHQVGYLRDYTKDEIHRLVRTSGLEVDELDARGVAGIDELDLHVWTRSRESA